jgi:hypothetical protein
LKLPCVVLSGFYDSGVVPAPDRFTFQGMPEPSSETIADATIGNFLANGTDMSMK